MFLFFFFFFCFFRCFASLFHSYEHKKRDESSEVYVTLKKKKNQKDKICMLMYITWVFFLLFLFFNHFFEGKLIQNRTMAERKYLEICMQPRDAGTHERVHFSYCEDRLYIVYEDIVMYSWRSPMDIPCASSSQIWSPLLLH